MNKNEEMVYSLMGLDPILLLEEPPRSENYTVHILRPGEEEGEDKNNSNITPLKIKGPIENDLTNSKETEKVKEEEEEEEEINIDLDEERNELINATKTSINEQNEFNSNETKEADEDPRRKRRRSSASS
tara:strand:- start:664 stop:1053 length:390 start_codon:yes stop_codon:yes gene_type:complete